MAQTDRNWRGEERRDASRFRGALDITCSIAEEPGQPLKARSGDLSVSGVMVVSSRNVPVGAQIEVTLADRAEGAAVKFEGIVRRCVPMAGGDLFRVGVEFVKPTEESRKHILRLRPSALRERPTQEARRHVRLNCAAAAWYRSSWFGRWQAVKTLNLSGGGMMFRAPALLEPGRRLRLRLRLSGPGELAVGAEVVGCVPDALGQGSRVSVRFVNLTASAKERIGAFVADMMKAREGRGTPAGPWRLSRVGLLVRSVAMVIAVMVLAGLLAQSMRRSLPLYLLGRNVYDAKIRMRGVKPTHPNVLIVAVDEQSLEKLAAWGNGYPRTEPDDARVVANLSRWGACVAAFTRPRSAESFAAIARTAGDMPVIRSVPLPADPLALPAAAVSGSGRSGFVDLATDPDSAVRRACLAVGDEPSLALALAETYAGATLLPRRQDWQYRLVNYRGPAGTFPSVPYWQVAEGALSPAVLARFDATSSEQLFADKIVLVGVMHNRLAETCPTPFTAESDTSASGVEIHATLVDNLLVGDQIRDLPGWVDSLILLGAALIAAGAFYFLRPWMAAVVLLVELALLVAAPIWILTAHNLVVSQVGPIVTAVLGACLALSVRVAVVTGEKHFALSQWDDLRERHEARERSLVKARGIVESLLPDAAELPCADRLDVGASFRPTEGVGGDIFDLLQTGPDRVAVVFADVAGHGIGAALVAAMVKSVGMFLQDHANDPQLFLDRVNKNLGVMLPDEMFVAIFYGVIDLEQQTLQYTNAGHHPLPVLLTAEDGGPRVLSEAAGMVAGAAFDYAYESATVPFRPGDALLLCSDGVCEGRIDREDGGPLPDDLLARLADPALPLDRAVEEIRNWIHRTPRVNVSDDDETVLIVRRKS